MNNFADKLRQLRKDRGYTQKELAVNLGLSERLISYYEKDQKRPTMTTVSKIAKYFDVSIDYLAGIEPYESEEEEAAFGEMLEDFIEEKLLLLSNNPSVEVINFLTLEISSKLNMSFSANIDDFSIKLREFSKNDKFKDHLQMNFLLDILSKAEMVKKSSEVSSKLTEIFELISELLDSGLSVDELKRHIDIILHLYKKGVKPHAQH